MITKIPKQFGIAGIWQTMYIMRDIVYQSVKDREIKDTAVEIIKDIEPLNSLEQVKAIFNWIRKKVRYVKDYYSIEEIQYPRIMLKNIKVKGYAYGDCDDMALLSASMLYSIGMKTRFVVIATKPKHYNHIRTEVMIKDKWIPLELSSRLPFGRAYQTYEKPLILEI